MSMEKNRTPRSTESVCIQTDRIYDSCKSKECVENLRVYFSEAGQTLIESVNQAKLKCAEVIYVNTDVEKVQFNRCCYNVNLTYYFRVIVEVATPTGTTCVEGLATYNKCAMLFGSEVSSYVFSSNDAPYSADTNYSQRASLPTAIVETVDPIVLDLKITNKDLDTSQISNCCNLPACVCCCYPDGVSEAGENRVYISLGLFTLIRLQRSAQLLIPCYDYCIPTKECKSISNENNPCSFFSKLDFPFESFYPANCCSNNTISSHSCNNNNCQGTIPYSPGPGPNPTPDFGER